VAIQFGFTDEFLNNNPQAYARMRHFMVDQPKDAIDDQGHPIEAIISCDVYIYKDYAAFLAGAAPHIKSYAVNTTTAIAAVATIMTAYDYIKSLPEFIGAINVA
jgi:hypothetical protein